MSVSMMEVSLDGEVADDALWQTWWRQISNLTPRFYDAPNGNAGRCFATLLTEELRGARERRWNSERSMVFIGTMLAKIPGVKKSKDIRARLLRGVDQWKDGIISDLVKDTYGTGKSHNDRARTISERDHKERTSMAYDQNVKADHIWSAVRHQTGGHLQSPGRETLQTQPIPERAGGG